MQDELIIKRTSSAASRTSGGTEIAIKLTRAVEPEVLTTEKKDIEDSENVKGAFAELEKKRTSEIAGRM